MSHSPDHAASALGWNPDDPHGTNTHAHGHVVVGWRTQLAVLAALLFFTALTVAFYNLEAWVEGAFGIHLPLWVNVAGAMSIACVKATLVCMFFMQLRYDKPLNTFALLFCLFAVGLFLFFATLDLSTRGRVNAFKFGEIEKGGTGVALFGPPKDPRFDARLSPQVNTGGKDLVETRGSREAVEAFFARHPEKTEEEWWHYAYHHSIHPTRHAADIHNYFAMLGYDNSHDELSTSQKRHVRTGLSGALDLADPAENGHAGGHGAGHESGQDAGHEPNSDGHASEPEHGSVHE